MLAAALRLSLAEVLRRIRVREITAVHEYRVDDDVGRERLIFSARDCRVQLLVDATTRHVLEYKVARLPRRARSLVKASMAAQSPAVLTTAASGGSDKPQMR